MVFYVRDSLEKNLIEIEIYWKENNNDGRWYWTIDSHSYFYMKNFLPVFVDMHEFMASDKLAKFVDDIDKIQQFRGYIHETLNVNHNIDIYNVNSRTSHDWYRVVCKEAEQLLKSFCDEYGFYFYAD